MNAPQLLPVHQAYNYLDHCRDLELAMALLVSKQHIHQLVLFTVS